MKFRLLFLLFCLLGTCLLANLDIAQVNQAKAATVLIETQRGEGYGSGFCISADGLVVTNYHVIEDIPAKQIRAFLHPGEPNQQTFRAEVLRQDKDLDLALLRLVVVKEPLTFLELGETAKLFETTQLTAFGYPFGKSLAVSKDAYPGVSVNVGKVTSLRRLRDGTLCEIQMDVLVNPGNSGGPVLGPEGKVVGVTVRGIPGSGVNFAIPVDQVSAFLMTPELLVEPVPDVPWNKRYEPVNLQIKAVCLVPLQGKLECRAFLLPSPDPRPMAVTETESGRSWTATAPLLEPPAPDAPVKVAIETADGTFTTTIPNRTIGFLFKSEPNDL
ncbi:MAG: serine protease, partial [Lentisphaeria bacterium]|nr:serine protease [Lentisphaeria bacterium]